MSCSVKSLDVVRDFFARFPMASGPAEYIERQSGAACGWNVALYGTERLQGRKLRAKGVEFVQRATPLNAAFPLLYVECEPRAIDIETRDQTGGMCVRGFVAQVAAFGLFVT